jgi:hypothetical protein
VAWVWRAMGCPQSWRLLVDETQLGDPWRSYCWGGLPAALHPAGLALFSRAGLSGVGARGLGLNLRLPVRRVLSPAVKGLAQVDRRNGSLLQLCHWIDELLGGLQRSLGLGDQ